MAFITCNYHSNVLGKATSMNVVIPQEPLDKSRPPYPVLYLLHGLSDDHTIWERRTSIERYATMYDLVVVMPNGDRGFYTDALNGFPYWTMLSEELPNVVRNLFPVSQKREETFAAGLSMGGYGALKLALRKPEMFGGAVGISSVADIPNWLLNRYNTPEMKNIFGDKDRVIQEGNDLFALAEKTAKMANPPKIMSICGTEDFLYDDNAKFRDFMKSIKYPGYIYHEGPGTHNWGFWDQWIQLGLKFLLGTN